MSRQAPQAPPVVYNVKMPDGSMVDIPVAADLPPERLAGVIEGAVRARTRIKNPAAQAQAKYDTAQPAPSYSDMFKPDSLMSTLGNLARGTVAPVRQAAGQFMEGARMLNQDPVGTITGAASTLKPEVGPMPGGVPGMWASMSGDPATEVASIPAIGQIATQAGQTAAQGRPAEALGNITGDTILNWLAAKGGYNTLARAKTAAIPRAAMSNVAEARVVAPGQAGGAIPTAAKMAPHTTEVSAGFSPQSVMDLAENGRVVAPGAGRAGAMYSNEIVAGRGTVPMGEATHRLKSNLAAERGLPSQMNAIDLGAAEPRMTADALRQQLSGTRAGPPGSAATGGPPIGAAVKGLDIGAGSRNMRIRLPFRTGMGEMIPVYMDIPGSGSALDALGRFMKTTAGSAGETFWLQRVLHYAVPVQEGEPPSHR